MEADPDFNKDVIGIDGEDVSKAEKELIQYNYEMQLGLAALSILWIYVFGAFLCL